MKGDDWKEQAYLFNLLQPEAISRRGLVAKSLSSPEEKLVKFVSRRDFRKFGQIRLGTS
jgi:hypothetical protein